MKIINVGKAPPPVGGVTSFIERLKICLEKNGFRADFYDVSGRDVDAKTKRGYICTNPMGAFLRIIRENKALVMFHTPNPVVLAAVGILGRKHTMLLWAHGSSTLSALNRNWKKRQFCRFDYIITPTQEMKGKIEALAPLGKEKVTVTPFILYPESSSTYSSREFEELRKNVNRIFCVYAYKLSYYEGKDLYGLDMSVMLLKNLRDRGWNVGLVMLLPDVSDTIFHEKLCAKISEYGLEDYVVRIETPLPDASVLYRAADIYLRPSNIDGDAFSVREALYVGTPVIASDAVVRPEECMLFRSRSDGDLLEKAERMLEHYGEWEEKAMRYKRNGGVRKKASWR